ncbi:MAG: alkyl hydroperoxide reductase AhpD [Pseudomonadota bacterium]
MTRIAPATLDSAPAASVARMQAVQKQLGFLPNMMATMGQAPVVLQGYLGLSEALRAGQLTHREREGVALAVAQVNGCDYCLAVHSYFGQRVGMTDAEVQAARQGESAKPRELAVYQLATRVLLKRGHIGDAGMADARATGLDDGLVLEVVAHVAMNFFTNTLNHVVETDIDFPPAR